jgi:hypothetical protein
MWRLAIARDDIGRELDGMVVMRAQDTEHLWEACLLPAKVLGEHS